MYNVPNSKAAQLFIFMCVVVVQLNASGRTQIRNGAVVSVLPPLSCRCEMIIPHQYMPIAPRVSLSKYSGFKTEQTARLITSATTNNKKRV